MISKTIGCRGTQHFQTNPNAWEFENMLTSGAMVKAVVVKSGGEISPES